MTPGGFEPSTNCLRGNCSAVELRSQIFYSRLTEYVQLCWSAHPADGNYTRRGIRVNNSLHASMHPEVIGISVKLIYPPLAPLSLYNWFSKFEWIIQNLLHNLSLNQRQNLYLRAHGGAAPNGVRIFLRMKKGAPHYSRILRGAHIHLMNFLYSLL